MPNKLPDGRPSTGTSAPTPGSPGPAPDRPSVPTDDSGGDVRPQPNPPSTPGINLTGGDQQEIAGLDAELLDIALMEDPDAGGEIATASGIRMAFVDGSGDTPGEAPPDQGDDLSAGGIATASGIRMELSDDAEDAPSDESRDVARRTEVRDAHDRFALMEDPDAGGEIARKAGGGQPDVLSDPEGGGEVAVHRAAVDGIDGEVIRKDHEDEVDVLDDPDGGGEIDGGFGTGAPPRPVTMTADDLRADPDEGGELTEDPDGGGEAPPSAVDSLGIGIDDLEVAEDPDAGGEVTWGGDGDDSLAAPVDVEPSYAEPVLDATDLELSSDFDEASHTFDPE